MYQCFAFISLDDVANKNTLDARLDQWPNVLIIIGSNWYCGSLYVYASSPKKPTNQFNCPMHVKKQQVRLTKLASALDGLG
jgi:hypothetical protein